MENLYYVPERAMRMNAPMLKRYGYTEKDEGVHALLTNVCPAYDPLTQVCIDTNTVSDPDQKGNYSIMFEIAPLPVNEALKNVQIAKLNEIITGSNACAAMVKGRYSALEIDSWAIQQTQAEAVLAGGTLADDALLTVLAAANGVPVTDFAARVMQNVLTAEALTKWVVSRQQYYETELKKIMADTETDDTAKIESIQEITVDFTLPEGANLMADPEVSHEQNG